MSSTHSRYFPNVEEELEKISMYQAYSEDVEEVMETFHNLNNKLLEKEYEIKADEIFKCIPMKMEQFYERFDKECMDIPIFKYFDSYQIFQRLTCASNEDVVIIKERLIKRAEQHPELIDPEKENMRLLRMMISDYIKGKYTTIKTVILKGVIDDLGKVYNLT